MKIPEFKNKDILTTAFTHRSYLNEAGRHIPSNERLEFLGDSILSYVTSSYLFDLLPDINEGELTNLRSILTNTETLYLVALELNLGPHLRLSRGEEQNNGRENKTILANTVESIIGALFVDQGIEGARKFIEDTILSQKDKIIEAQGLKDPKSGLQEKLQEVHPNPPTYAIVEESGPDHAKHYVVEVVIDGKSLARGEGTSKQAAEKAAAANALRGLEQNNPTKKQE